MFNLAYNILERQESKYCKIIDMSLYFIQKSMGTDLNKVHMLFKAGQNIELNYCMKINHLPACRTFLTLLTSPCTRICCITDSIYYITGTCNTCAKVHSQPMITRLFVTLPPGRSTQEALNTAVRPLKVDDFQCDT